MSLILHVPLSNRVYFEFLFNSDKVDGRIRYGIRIPPSSVQNSLEVPNRNYRGKNTDYSWRLNYPGSHKLRFGVGVRFGRREGV